MLQNSMDRYGGMKTFATAVEWRTGHGPSIEDAEPHTRLIAYAAPNRFRLESHASNGFSQTSVCDGKTFVEYSNHEEQREAMSYPVPKSLATVSSMQTTHPMFCGTLLLPFFGGRGELDRLVDRTKYEPRILDADAFPSEEPLQTVEFYGAGMYGNASATIGLESGLVYGIVYDSEPLMAMMNNPEHRKMMRRAIKAQIESLERGEKRDQMERYLSEYDSKPEGVAPTSITIEAYSKFRIDEPMAPDAFDTRLPAGVSTRDMSDQGRSEPPIPVGEAAPDFEVVRLGGGPVKLSDLRGRVVFIDFWATWCGPCRKGLPETDRLAALGEDSGLAVMAITREPAGMVSEFLQEEGFTFPCYIDEGGAAQGLYRPPGIPAVVIVDREGIVSDYFIGLQQPKTIEAALKKAGAKV